jgi:hypothetical protein
MFVPFRPCTARVLGFLEAEILHCKWQRSSEEQRGKQGMTSLSPVYGVEHCFELVCYRPCRTASSPAFELNSMLNSIAIIMAHQMDAIAIIVTHQIDAIG